MTEDIKKTLPMDTDSDHSLPGRFEESNTEYFEEKTTNTKPKNRWIWMGMLSFVIVSSGFFAYYFLNQDDIDSQIIQNAINRDPEKKLVDRYNIGKYGSDHAHAAIVVLVDNSQVNFGLQQFQLASKYIHFEDNNPYLIHKHAIGVPLEMLFESLGIEITQECIRFNSNTNYDAQTKYCISQDQDIVTYLNGKRYNSDIFEHEIKHGDRILISFGDSTSITKTLAYLETLKIFDIPRKDPQFFGDEIMV